MRNDDLDLESTDDVWPAAASCGPEARAYGGPAHGVQWPLGEDEPPPWTEVPIGESSCLYRLVRQPRTGQPAHDYLGNYLYVPIAADAPTAADEMGRVLRFPSGGRNPA